MQVGTHPGAAWMPSLLKEWLAGGKEGRWYKAAGREMQHQNNTAPAGFQERQQRGAGRFAAAFLDEGKQHQGWVSFLKRSCCSHARLFLTWNHLLLSEAATSLLLKGQASIE